MFAAQKNVVVVDLKMLFANGQHLWANEFARNFSPSRAGGQVFFGFIVFMRAEATPSRKTSSGSGNLELELKMFLEA